MFDSLSDKITGSFKKLRGLNKISESNIEDSVKEIRLSLLEADVHYKVVKNFIDRIKAKSLGADVLKNVNPGQMFVKIVHQELVETLGGAAVDLDVRKAPAVIFLVGLQGAGKTTTAAKLALYIRQKLGKKPGLIPADVYRPAAIDQLQTLAKQINVPVFSSNTSMKPEEILEKSKNWIQDERIDAVIVDTAGRLQVDDALMEELERLQAIAPPSEILLVADAMLGQQAVAVSEEFHRRLKLTGLVLTKVDGDARGGAALSIREVTGVPMKFLGIGEKVAALELFHPDRLAGRILGMGDVLSLVEKAQEAVSAEDAKVQAQRMMRNEFTLEDFLSQIQTLKKIGGFESLLKFLPGMGDISKQLKNMSPPDDELKKVEAIIRSMTKAERTQPKILNASRRVRIAKGSGTQVQDINRLVKQFEDMQKMMGQMMKMGFGGMKKGMKFPF